MTMLTVTVSSSLDHLLSFSLKNRPRLASEVSTAIACFGQMISPSSSVVSRRSLD